MYEVVVLKNTRISLSSYHSFTVAWATISDYEKNYTTVERRRRAYQMGEHVPRFKGAKKLNG